MTARPQILYRCDRCHTEEHADLDSGAPPHKRMSGPDGWLVLRIGDDPASPQAHLCLACRGQFDRFMIDKLATDDNKDKMCEALHRIDQWCKAYPVQVFPAMTSLELEKAGEVLDKAGYSAGRIHAQWARHILKDIAETVAKGLAE